MWLQLSDSATILVMFHGSSQVLTQAFIQGFLLCHQTRTLEEPSSIALAFSQSAMDVCRRVLKPNHKDAQLLPLILRRQF